MAYYIISNDIIWHIISPESMNLGCFQTLESRGHLETLELRGSGGLEVTESQDSGNLPSPESQGSEGLGVPKSQDLRHPRTLKPTETWG